MITRLHLVNFRRHRDTQLTFSADEQLTLISGDNGVGKSTLFQALLWALVADSGRVRRSEQLIRRGCEVEGMSVEVDLLLEGTTWTVRRHRDLRGSGATLSREGEEMVTGAAAVTDAVTALLGTDAVGLRLAVYAAQGELDALASLRPADRATAVARLMRVEEFTRARDAARAQARAVREVLSGLASPAQIDQDSQRITEQEAELAALASAHAASVQAIADLDRDLAASDGLDESWAQANREYARAEGLVHAAEEALVRIDDELRTVESSRDDMRAQLAGLRDIDVAGIAEQQRTLEQAITRAEQSQSILAHRESCQRELDRSHERLAVLESLLLAGDDTVLSADLLVLDASLADAESALDAARRAQAELTWPVVPPDAPACPACGQDIDSDHRLHLERARADAEQARARLTAQVDHALDRVRTLRAQRADLVARADQVRAATAERADLRRRCQVWADQLARTADLVVTDADLLYAERARLAVAASHAQRKTELTAHLDQVTTRIAALQGARADAEARAREARMHQVSCQVSDDLRGAWQEREKLRARREVERDLLADLDVRRARLESALDRARAELAQAQAARAQRSELTAKAQAHADAAASLDRAATLLTSRLRPALAGEVSQLLSQLSEGRFTQVRLDEGYALEVFDDGDWRDVADCSGGERDLIALAVRLGLAESLSGARGLGWILLDEVFGSQDPGRRDQILVVLRALRSRFTQILTISHVGGLDDTADRVIELTLADADDGLPAVQLAR